METFYCEGLTIDMSLNRHAPSPLEGVGLLVPPRDPICLLVGPYSNEEKKKLKKKKSQ